MNARIRESLLVTALVSTLVVAGVVGQATGHNTEPTRGPVTAPTLKVTPIPTCEEDGVPSHDTNVCQWVDEGQQVITTYSDGIMTHTYADGSSLVVFEDGEVWQYTPDGKGTLVVPGTDATTSPEPTTTHA